MDLLERRPNYDFTGMPEPLNSQLGIGCIQLEELANRVIIEQNTITETGHDAQNLTVAEAFSRLGYGRNIHSTLAENDRFNRDDVIMQRCGIFEIRLFDMYAV